MALSRPSVAVWATVIALTAGSAGFADAVPVGDEFQVNTYTNGDQEFQALAGTPDGGFIVVWESAGSDGFLDGVALQRYDSAGQAVGGELQVNTYTTAGQEDPSVAVGDDGAFVVVWDGDNFQDGDQRGIFGQRFDASANPVGDEFQVNAIGTADQNDAVVAKFSDGGFVVAWEDERAGAAEDVVARRFDSAGNPVGDEIEVNDFVVGDQEDIAIATDAADNFVVAWESFNQDGSFDAIVVRRFDSDGIPLAGETVVNVYTTGDQVNPSLAVQPDGSFVVAWEDDTRSAPDLRTVARFFDSAGNPISGEVEVSQIADQGNPAVAPGSDGSATIVWDSAGPDGSGLGVFGRSFDAAGGAIGDEFQVNVTTSGSQGYPAIAASDSDFLVVWRDLSGADGSGVGLFGRRLSADAIFTDGFESGDFSAWSSVSP